jgi:calcium-dependent protein kinase
VKSIPKHRRGLAPSLQRAYEGKIRSEVDTQAVLGRSLDCLTLYDVFEDETEVHLVLERASRGNVWSSEAFCAGHFSEAAAATIMRTVLRSVAQCHACGVVFRDIKPENFLLTEAGVLKLSDFGLASRLAPGQQLSERCGTLAYVSPEVVSQRYGFATDLWSAGVMAYQLLSGRLPFGGGEGNGPGASKEAFRSILFDPLDLHSPPWDAVSAAAKDFVTRLLERDPERRISCHDALEHAWCRPEGIARAAPLGGTVLARLQRFGVSGALSRSVLRAVATGAAGSESPSPELQAVERLFDSLSGGTGELTRAALVAGLTEMGYRASEDEWALLLDELDARGEGVVRRPDFLAALADWRRLAGSDARWGEWVERAFLAFGGDAEGVSAERLLAEVCDVEWEHLGGAVCRSAVEKTLEDVREEGGGSVSREAWARLLASAGSDEPLDEFDARLAPR